MINHKNNTKKRAYNRIRKFKMFIHCIGFWFLVTHITITKFIQMQFNAILSVRTIIVKKTNQTE
jgi:hypothetical protein